MGTDIQIFAERLTHDGWQLALGLEPNIEPMTEREEIEPPYCPRPLWTNRVYEVFAVLAGVRNEGLLVRPISPPRGLPADMSADLRTWAAYWPEMQSPSWLSGEEVLAYGAVERGERLLPRLFSSLRRPPDSWQSFVHDAVVPVLGERPPRELRLVFWFSH